MARYEKAKRNRQGFASLAVLLRLGWFQAMGRDGGQPRQPWPFFDLFRSAKWTLRRGAVRVVKRGNFRGYSSQTTLSDRAHFSQRHVESLGRGEGALRQGHRQCCRAWQASLRNTGCNGVARVLPCRVLAEPHLCARRQTFTRNELFDRGPASAVSGADDDTRAIAGSGSAVHRKRQGARSSRGGAPRQQGGPGGAPSRDRRAAACSAPSDASSTPASTNIRSISARSVLVRGSLRRHILGSPAARARFAVWCIRTRSGEDARARLAECENEPA